jgi:uncharacterized protein (TIGR00255 family)
MLKSMTGYGRAEGATTTHLYTVEVQALNHRFTDIRVKLPRALAALEHELHREVQRRFHRGRFDIQVAERLQGEVPRLLRIDQEVARQYVEALRELQAELRLSGEVTVDALIGLRDLVSLGVAEVDVGEVGTVLKAALHRALDEVDSMRGKEGEALAQDVAACLDRTETTLQAVEIRGPQVVEAYRLRLQERASSLLGVSLPDPDRLEQEVVLFADRSDIAEECTRLRSHLRQFRETLPGPGPHGRRLEFLLQEMQREVNTIGAKAADALISQMVVQMKTDVERLREQVQNIE